MVLTRRKEAAWCFLKYGMLCDVRARELTTRALTATAIVLRRRQRLAKTYTRRFDALGAAWHA